MNNNNNNNSIFPCCIGYIHRVYRVIDDRKLNIIQYVTLQSAHIRSFGARGIAKMRYTLMI